MNFKCHAIDSVNNETFLSSTFQQDSDDEISHLEWETVRVRFVKAATLSRLVDALTTDDGELESTFVNVFLTTYRTFSQPEKVLELLLNRYERLHSEPAALLPASESLTDQHKKTLGRCAGGGCFGD